MHGCKPIIPNMIQNLHLRRANTKKANDQSAKPTLQHFQLPQRRNPNVKTHKYNIPNSKTQS